MSGLLLALEVADRRVLVAGGGTVAERKVGRLLEAGARVAVVAPRLTEALAELAAAGRIEWAPREWADGDVAGAWLVFAATDSEAVNQAIAQAARSARLWCDVAAPGEAGDAQVLATVRDGPLQIGIGTGGASPYVARRVRELIEAALPARLGSLVELLGEVRGSSGATQLERRAVYERIWSSDALARLQAGDEEGARAVVAACLER